MGIYFKKVVITPKLFSWLIGTCLDWGLFLEPQLLLGIMVMFLVI